MKRSLSLLTAAAFSAAFTLASFAAPKDWIGKELPPLKVEFLGAKPDLKGKPIIVEFWATWCQPCRDLIPHLNEINKKFKNKGLVVIGISDEEKGTVEKFRKEVPMEYHVALGGAELTEELGIIGVPYALIVGKNGKIAWEGLAVALAEEEIEKVLK